MRAVVICMNAGMINLRRVCVLLLSLWLPVIALAASTDIQDMAQQDMPVAKAPTATTADTSVDEALFAKAVSLSEKQQWAEAESIYRELLKSRPQWPEPKNNLAIVLLKTGRLEQAKQMLEQAVVSSPSYRVAQANRSQLYNYLATQAYHKALGEHSELEMPTLDLIGQIHQNVKLVEKPVQVIVEKRIEVPVEVVVEKPVIDRREFTRTEEVDVSAERNRLIKQQIQQQLTRWSQAWSAGDYETYIQTYASEFDPGDPTTTLAEWKNIRHAKLKYARDTRVTLDKLRVFVEASAQYALVEFVQAYRSASYSDTVLKQLYMTKNDNNWRILSERVIKTY
jgi:tetratricopeptide (TPR) repeat protein